MADAATIAELLTVAERRVLSLLKVTPAEFAKTVLAVIEEVPLDAAFSKAQRDALTLSETFDRLHVRGEWVALIHAGTIPAPLTEHELNEAVQVLERQEAALVASEP